MRAIRAADLARLEHARMHEALRTSIVKAFLATVCLYIYNIYI